MLVMGAGAPFLFGWFADTLAHLSAVQGRQPMKSTSRGMLYAASAFLIWGVCPLYFKLLSQVPAGEILAHRIVWSCALLLLLVLVGRSGYRLVQLARHPRQLLYLMLSALLVGTNWLIFIWSVNHGQLLEASLGYYINPLFNILLGMLFLGERLRRLQWLAVGLALAGVLIQVQLLGRLPWIALALAGSFGFYGLIRKQIPVDALTGLLVETLLLLPAAAWYLFGFAASPTSTLTTNGASLNLLLLSAGIVTTVPLLCFTAAARRLPLTTLGFFQYLAPSLMFVLAVLVFHEPFVPAKLLTFALIWGALTLFSWDGLQLRRQAAPKPSGP